MATASLFRFASFYNVNFDRRPIPTLIITNGILNSIADALAQASSLLFSKDTGLSMRDYEPERTLRFAVYGMAMGPLIGGWMRLLERGIPIKQGANGNTFKLAQRVLADQAVMAPIGLVLFVGSMGIMEGKGPTEIKAKFSDMYFPALLANWKVWPLLQTVNFKLVPLPYRVPFQSTCGIAWTLYLSLLNAKDDAKAAAAEN
ncbi:MAG: hypothetical protein TREMPRED_000794 [Tremellales sp. Tagirdzhanova-0007]|nr:MAG: hypothetical protein TREMPRED_000794 [Tremellales sp. Tagirdzhanova-0007]